MRLGFAEVRALMPSEELAALAEILGDCASAGERGLLSRPEIAALAGSPRFLAAVRPHLPGEPRPVRAIYFDKSAHANWLVPWHQDLSIAVEERLEAAEFGPWSVKEGLIHVQPPQSILESMITLRLHLDLTDETNGALRVIPGSHLLGKLSATEIQSLRQTSAEHLCAAAPGDALLMRPLILHASSRSVTDRRRRVLHIEYAGCDLPHGLRWNEQA
jgi:hypothetical protein